MRKRHGSKSPFQTVVHGGREWFGVIQQQNPRLNFRILRKNVLQIKNLTAFSPFAYSAIVHDGGSSSGPIRTAVTAQQRRPPGHNCKQKSTQTSSKQRLPTCGADSYRLTRDNPVSFRHSSGVKCLWQISHTEAFIESSRLSGLRVRNDPVIIHSGGGH
jgi:hypothetical protein